MRYTTHKHTHAHTTHTHKQPKTPKNHKGDTGLLEYLEDIVGTDQLVPQIEEAGKGCVSGSDQCSDDEFGCSDDGVGVANCSSVSLLRHTKNQQPPQQRRPPPTHAHTHTRTTQHTHTPTNKSLEALNQSRQALIGGLKAAEKEVSGLEGRKLEAEAYLSKQGERLRAQMRGNAISLHREKVCFYLLWGVCLSCLWGGCCGVCVCVWR